MKAQRSGTYLYEPEPGEAPGEDNNLVIPADGNEQTKALKKEGSKEKKGEKDNNKKDESSKK
jgi:hypothetical protein